MSILSQLRAPVFQEGGRPEIDKAQYRLHIRGLVKEERSFTWQEIVDLPASKVDARLTSVSGWSVRATWEGVLWRDFIRILKPKGKPLEREYGGPLRMVIPNLYGYKSCKWLETITLSDTMRGGYWEDRGYTRSGIIEPGFTLDVNAGIRRPISGGEVTEF